MSHKATNWAIQQRGLTPSAKILLWHLCDRYHPDNGCFPSQATLAYDCEVHRATINRLLAELEKAGLVRREQRVDERTKRKQSTRYLLAFEEGFEPTPLSGDSSDAKHSENGGETSDQTPQSGDRTENEHTEHPCRELRHGAVSHLGSEPCRISDDFHVANCDTNSVREPVIEPVKVKIDFSSFLEKFFSAYPRGGDRDTCGDLLRRAIEEDGVEPGHILAAVRSYASEVRGRQAQYVAYPENWLAKRRWEDHKPAAAKTDAEVAAFWVPRLKAGDRIAIKTISADLVRSLIAGEFISEAECREAGVL